MMLKQLIVSAEYELVDFLIKIKKCILGNLKDLNSHKKINFLLLGLGCNYLRAYLFKNLKKKKYNFLTFVHSLGKNLRLCKN